jgi:hypothetical protein
VDYTPYRASKGREPKPKADGNVEDGIHIFLPVVEAVHAIGSLEGVRYAPVLCE